MRSQTDTRGLLGGRDPVEMQVKSQILQERVRGVDK